MRILHTNMLRGWGGQSNRILTEALGTRAAGHEVAFAVPHDSVLAKKGREAGLTVFPDYAFKPPAQLWKFIPDLRRLRRDIRAWQPDILHLHGSQDTWLAVIARSLGGPFPILLRTKHNIFDWKKHASNRWLYGQVDAYESISSFIDRQVAEYPGLGDKPRACIPSVPDVEEISRYTRVTDPAERTARRAELMPGVPADCFLWGSTGRLRWEKGFDVLLPAFAELRRAQPNAHLVIAGDGSDKSSLEAQATQLGLGQSVHFLGFRKDVPAILSVLDGYVLASRSEGLGTAILEALAAGLPVVATNVGGIPDSVHHERTGLLVPNENPKELAAAMHRLMEDDSLRNQLGIDARKLVLEVFTAEKLTADTVAYYERLVQKGARASLPANEKL